MLYGGDSIDLGKGGSYGLINPLEIVMDADEEDITYDEITAGLLVGEVRRKRQDLFEALGIYYKIYVLGEKAADALDEEEENGAF